MNLPVPPVLTRRRIWTAYGIAATADVLQLVLGPIGVAFADEIIDVAAMALLWRLLGFHPLLLPTFVLEVVPIADLIPAWTACVALVIALRRRQQGPPPSTSPQPPVPPRPSGPIIDV
jgi:hypothetical protein